jgi:CHAT domain/TIR domain
MRREKLFISYSHKDGRWLERVREQLAVLEREGLIDPFEDSQIDVGEDWYERLDKEMLEARLALLLVSASFLTSSFIRKEEIPRLFSRHAENGMVLYPLLVRDCPWQEVSWLARLQMRPRNTRPIASMRSATQDKCLADVAREIASIIRAELSSNVNPARLGHREVESTALQPRKRAPSATEGADDGTHPSLVRTSSGSELPLSGLRTQCWQHVLIQSVGRESLSFQIVGRGQEPLVHSIQRPLVERLLKRCIHATSLDHGTANRLFELLVPRQLKSTLFGERGTVLILDVASARFPWELLQDRDNLPFSVQKGVIRQIASDSTTHYPRGGSGKALVIGDPVSGLPFFPPLPGVQDEARQVAEVLRESGFSVNLQVNCSSEDTFGALFSGPYQILHLTGHGVVDYEPTSSAAHGDLLAGRKITGFVMGENAYFTSVEAAQMREVSEFVFLNCNHLGQLSDSVSGTGEQNRFAASALSQLKSRIGNC